MFPTALLRNTPTHHLITLLRSPIGLPKTTSRTLESLALYRSHQSVLYPFSAPLAGKILRVKELVAVRNVTEEEGTRALAHRKSRGEGMGLEVAGRAWGGGASAER
jgi:large subunit ribosomal protein L30